MILRDVAYERQSASQRATAHAAVATEIEKIWRGDLAPDYRCRRPAREHNTARAGALTLRRVPTRKSSNRLRNDLF